MLISVVINKLLMDCIIWITPFDSFKFRMWHPLNHLYTAATTGTGTIWVLPQSAFSFGIHNYILSLSPLSTSRQNMPGLRLCLDYALCINKTMIYFFFLKNGGLAECLIPYSVIHINVREGLWYDVKWKAKECYMRLHVVLLSSAILQPCFRHV